MDEEYLIRETPQLKAVSNPLRMRMLEALIPAPHTATQLGALLHLAPSRAHYHLKQLEAAGLCRLVEERIQGGVMEKYYRAVAGRFRLARTVTAGEVIAPSEAEIDPRVQAAVRGYLQHLQAPEAAPADEAVLWELTLRLPPQRYARLLARLHALLLEFDSDSRDSRPGLHDYRLLLLGYRDHES